MSELGYGLTNVAYACYFKVVDSAGAAVTGLADVNFTKKLSVDGVNSAVTVTVSECDSVNLPGLYKASYTPNAAGVWTLVVSNATYNVAGWQDDLRVSATAEVKADATMISGDGPAADNAKRFFDGTGYNASNSAIGSIGDTRLANLDAAVSTRSSHSAADAGSAAATAILATPANKLATDASGRVTVGAIANGIIAAATFAANALDAVWSTSARALTDKAGFSLATDQSGVTIGTVNTVGAVTSVTTVTGDVNGKVLGGGSGTISGVGARAEGLTAARQAALDNLDAAVTTRLAAGSYTSPPSVAQIVAGIFSQVIDTYTFLQSLKLWGAVLLGASSGGKATGASSPVFMAQDGSKVRISATVDADGNRTAVTLDET